MEIHGVQTWYDSHHGVVSVEDDVLNVVREVREIAGGRIHVFYNERAQQLGRPCYDLVESCLDGTDRLVFSVHQLDQRVVNRLRSADQWRGRDDPEHVLPEEADFLTEMDDQNEEWFAGKEADSRQRLYDAGERLAWAMGEDKRGVQAQILVPKDVSDGSSHKG